MLNKDSLLHHIEGSILGGAIGDALGGPVEGKSVEFIHENFGGKITDLVEYVDKNPRGANISTKRGTYTDDTRFKNILCKTIVEKKKRISAEDFAKVVLREMDPDLFFPTEGALHYMLSIRNILEKHSNISQLSSFSLLAAISPRNIGKINIPADDAVMMISPIGLLSPANPRQAARDTYEVASVIQNGYSLEAAICITTAVAESMRPDATLEDIVTTSMQYTDLANRAAIQKSVQIAKKADTFVDFKETFHREMLVGFVDVLEVVPACMGIILLMGKDFETAVIEAANFGRDCDSIASIVGSILGCYHSIDSVPRKWIRTVMEAQPEPDLMELSKGIYEATKSEFEETKEYVDSLRNFFD